jgi:hypothetical protein
MAGDVQQTARQSILLQQNAETGLGLASKMIASVVKQVGELMVDNIIRYQSIGEVGEITGETAYKSFLIDGKVKGGQDRTHHIRFTDRFAGQAMSQEDKEMEEYKMLDESGDEKDIAEVNPALFARMSYLITIDADKMLQKNDAFERAFKLETYDRAIANPLVQGDQDAMLKITRDFLFEPLMHGEAQRYMPNIQKVAQGLMPQNGEQNTRDLPNRMTQNNAMSSLPM